MTSQRTRMPESEPSVSRDKLEIFKGISFFAVPVFMIATIIFPLGSTGQIVCGILAYVCLFNGIAIHHLAPGPLDPPEPPAPAPPAPPAQGLTPDEIDAVLAMMPEASPEMRAQLQLLLKGRMKEKE